MRHEKEEHSLISDGNKLDEKYTTSETSADDKSGIRTLVQYDNNEASEIKEEFTQGLPRFVVKISQLKL